MSTASVAHFNERSQFLNALLQCFQTKKLPHFYICYNFFLATHNISARIDLGETGWNFTYGNTSFSLEEAIPIIQGLLSS